MTTLRDLVKVHIHNACHADKFNYHRYHLGSRTRKYKTRDGRTGFQKYEFAGDHAHYKAVRRSMGRSRRVLERLAHLCRGQLHLLDDWVKQADGMMINTWTEHGMRHRPRKVGVV